MAAVPTSASAFSIASEPLTESTFAPVASPTAEAAPSGFAARRNNTCLPAEVDCFFTTLPFVACCPLGSVCARQFNAVCCPSPDNCTATLESQPGCANQTWNLYDNGGFFCCDPTQFGYSIATGSGCGQVGDDIPDFAIKLPVLQSGLPATAFSTFALSSIASQTSAPVASASSTSPSSSSSSSSTNTGAIAGGVVGGIIALILVAFAIWFIMRRRRNNTKATPPPRDGFGVPYDDTKDLSGKGIHSFPLPPINQRRPEEQLHELPAPPPAHAGQSWLRLEQSRGPQQPRELP